MVDVGQQSTPINCSLSATLELIRGGRTVGLIFLLEPRFVDALFDAFIDWVY